jgi:type I restriction enzyme R subunit
VADEAHRTQYGFSTEIKRRDGGGLYTSQGHALNMRQALPNAAYIGFTGTPIDKEDANTIQIFGDYIHIYDMQQAKDDNAVVPIYYEARHIPLRLADDRIDDKVDALAEEAEVDAASLEAAKAKWSAVEQAAGVKERLDILARDLLAHFNSHQATLDGKAMIVCMSRRNAVALYGALTAFSDCPPVKVVMTGDLGEDPQAWSQAGHLTTKAARDDIKRHFIDPADPLKLVIVCDMWLTGFDAPCVNTLYVDKLMKGHNLMQAIARVNRIFGDKEGGLIVDYIGIDDRLKEATRKYTVGGGRGSLTGDLQHQAMTYFLGQLKATRAHMPDLAALITQWGEDEAAGRGELPHPYDLPDLSDLPGFSGMPRAHYQMLRRRDENLYANWRSLTNIQLEDLAMFVYGTLIANEQRKDAFLSDEYRLSKAFSLVKHTLIGQQNTEEVGFYQLIRRQLRKLDPAATQQARNLEGALRDLLDDSIAAQPAVDIYAVAGLDRPDVSILDEKFVVGHGGDVLKEDLQVHLLAKLLGDEIEARRRRNIVRYRSYKDMLEDALRQYNNRTITAQEVVEVMRRIRGEQQAEVQRQHKLGLNDEEIAFYDVIALGEEVDLHQTDEWIADLVRQVVKAVRDNLQVDWTKPHRSNIEAMVQAAVGRVLRRNQIKGEQFEFLRARLMKQARATYERWPVVM